MKCLLLKPSKGKGDFDKEVVSIIPSNSRLNAKDVRGLLVLDTGAIAISSVVNGNVDKTIILHTEAHHDNAIDIEQRLVERTAIMDTDVTFLDISFLVGKFLPETSINIKTELYGSDDEFVMSLKNHIGGTQIEYLTTLKFESMNVDNVKDKLKSFTQNLSKMAFFLETENPVATKLGQYLSCWRSITAKSFDSFTSSQFQQLISVSRVASLLTFEQCRDRVEYDDQPIINQIKKNINVIKDKVKERSAYNFKGIKIYITKDVVTVNMMGQSFSKPNDTVIDLCLAHIMMCGQLEDFKNKLERTRLLHA